MCFSATASFVTAGLTGIIGVAAMARAEDRRALPLAATPLLFAVQQSIEGMLWLTLPSAPDESVASGLSFLYLLFAEVFWPIYAPLAVWLIEPSASRRRLMLLCLGVGAGVAAAMLGSMLAHPPGARLSAGHIVYVTDRVHFAAVATAYFTATGLSLMLSSQRTILVLGTIVLLGSAIAFVAYWEAFASVWCFFAAAASMVILGHFEWEHRHRLRLAGA